MPIKKALQGFYPIDWTELSRATRFGRAKGKCEQCGRSHGRWFDPDDGTWRGRPEQGDQLDRFFFLLDESLATIVSKQLSSHAVDLWSR